MFPLDSKVVLMREGGRYIGGRGDGLFLLMYVVHTWPVNLEYDPESQTLLFVKWMRGLKFGALIIHFL